MDKGHVEHQVVPKVVPVERSVRLAAVSVVDSRVECLSRKDNLLQR